MNRSFILILLCLLTGSLHSQYFTKNEAHHLLEELKSARNDSTRIDLLLKIAEYHILPSYDHPSNFDSARLLMRQAAELNAVAKIKSADMELLLANSYFYRTSGERDKGRTYVMKAIDISHDGSNYDLLGQAYYELSNYYDYDFKNNTILQRTAYIEMAISAFKKSGGINHLGNSYKVLADLHHLNNEYYRAYNEIQTALGYYKTTNYKRLEGVYDLLGQLHYARGNYTEALSYELLALKTADSNYDAGPQLCEIENNVGLTFYKLNDPESALRHFKNALEIAGNWHDNEAVYGLTSHIVETYISMKKPQEGLLFLNAVQAKYKLPLTDKFETSGYMYKAYLNLYTSLKEYNAGRYYCNQLIQKSRAPGLDVFKLNGYYEEIIKYLTATKDYTNALKYLGKNKELVESISDHLGASRNYMLWFSLDTSQGNLNSAINNLLQANLINDTILNTTKASEIKQLEVQYESEKKENDIRVKDKEIQVLVQSDLLHKANLQRSKFIRNATLVTTLLLLALGGILYNQYRQKKKTNILITHRNAQLGHLLKEKEWLLKEVNHRVRNNLHTVFCLLESQAAYLKDDALNAVKNSQHRVYAMSLIHQKLYQNEDLKIVEMSNYLREFIAYLTDSFGISGQIRFDLQIEELKLDVTRAVPIALILNEAVTNSIKYAFPAGREGIIAIRLHVSGDWVSISIADNGIGIPKKHGGSSEGSLGIGLMEGLSEDINATIRFQNENGTKISIRFKKDELTLAPETFPSLS